MTSLRVRQLIPYLDYWELVKFGIIPTDIFAKTPAKTSFPVWANTQRSEFGLFVEGVVSDYISNKIDRVDMVHLKGVANNCYLNVTDEQLKSSEKLFWKFFHFSKRCGGGRTSVDVQKELIHPDVGRLVIGHPDLICHDTIYDVKTTANFYGMRIETVLQLVCYAALNGSDKIKHIGVLLPLNGEILTYPIEKINVVSLRNVLISEAKRLMRPLEIDPIYLRYIGSHISKCPKQKSESGCLKAIKDIHAKRGNLPTQMFLSSPQKKGLVDIGVKELADIKTFLQQNDLAYFTHAPYYINLARPVESTDEAETEMPWDVAVLKHELEVTAKMGGRGVVVHVGSAVHSENEDEGKMRMLDNVNSLLPFISDGCPLLLETGCGEGQELFCDSTELYEFVCQFPPNKVRMCMDTCHIFAAGHTPNRLFRIIQDRLDLIHFNDSSIMKGHRADKHWYFMQPGGQIGQHEMLTVLKMAIEASIPCVVE